MGNRFKTVIWALFAVLVYALLREAWDVPPGEGLMADPRRISSKLQERVALHEAGHAVAYAALVGPDHLLGLELCEFHPAAGENLGNMVPEEEDLSMMTPADMLHRASYLLAGQAANAVVGDGPTNGARDDVKRASDLVWRVHGQYGMGRTLAYYEDPDGAPPQIETDVELDLQLANACAAVIIDANRGVLIALAARLRSAPVQDGKHVLGPGALARFFQEHPVIIPGRSDVPWFCVKHPIGSEPETP